MLGSVDNATGRMVGAVLALVVLLLGVQTVTAAEPHDTAGAFVRAIRQADLEAAKRLLDDRKYRSAPRGGDDAYFRYDSGYEPNLAVLVGRPYSFNATQRSRARSDWYLLDGTEYATVSVRIGFAPEQRPWILPQAMAFGRPMTIDAFLAFIAAPQREWQYLTLRVRPGLDAVASAPALMPTMPPPPAPPGTRPIAVAPERGGVGLTGPQSFRPGPVVLSSGGTLSDEDIKRRLPRLSIITLDITLVRRGRFASWAISRWLFDDVVAITEQGSFAIDVGPDGREQR